MNHNTIQSTSHLHHHDGIINITRPEIKMSLGDMVRSAVARVNTLEVNPEDLQDLIFGIMDTIPRSTELMQLIKKAKSAETKDMLVEEQKLIYRQVEQELCLFLGLESDEMRVERENQEYREKLGIVISDVDEDTVLEKLGVLVPKSEAEGEVGFQYPEGVFPPHIDEKWKTYIDLVNAHEAIVARRNAGDASKETVLEIAQYDAIRKRAHDKLSEAVRVFFDDEEAWNFEVCRRLMAKMRDNEYPNFATREKQRTAQGILRLRGILEVIKKAEQ